MTAKEYKNFLARLTTRPISYFNLSSSDIVLYPANINLALFLLSDLAIKKDEQADKTNYGNFKEHIVKIELVLKLEVDRYSNPNTNFSFALFCWSKPSFS